MLAVGSNHRVVNFSNRFVNFGVSVLLKSRYTSDRHPCSPSSTSGKCGSRDTVSSGPKCSTSCKSYQHLSHSAHSARSAGNKTGISTKTSYKFKGSKTVVTDSINSRNCEYPRRRKQKLRTRNKDQTSIVRVSEKNIKNQTRQIAVALYYPCCF